MQCVTIYPNIYECASDYKKIYYDRFRTFYGHFANEALKILISIDKT